MNWIDRRPIVSNVTEASYCLHAICEPEAISAVRDLIDAALEAASYPIRDERSSDSEDLVELGATVLPTNAEASALDAVVASLETSPLVRSATWTVETRRIKEIVAQAHNVTVAQIRSTVSSRDY